MRSKLRTRRALGNVTQQETMEAGFARRAAARVDARYLRCVRSYIPRLYLLGRLYLGVVSRLHAPRVVWCPSPSV